MVAAVLLTVAGCGSDGEGGSNTPSTIEGQIRAVAHEQGLVGHPHLADGNLTAEQRAIRELRRDLGRNLFHDKALSGVEQTSCATCHHPAFQFSDARNIARGVFCDLSPTGERIDCHDAPAPGEGGNVVGPDRRSPLNSRNSPLLLNNGLYPRLMWNGRFHFIDESSTDVNECDPTLGFEFPSPERVLLTRSLLAGQAHIPVTEAVEMTGDYPHAGEPFEDADERNPEVREGISYRISDLPGYRPLFEAAYPKGRPETRISIHDPEIGPNEDIPYSAIADAIGHFLESMEFTDAPWDAFLQGDDSALSESAKRGALTFFTDGKCSSCHSGEMFSDFENYNIGVPQVGPGTGQHDPEPEYLGLRTYDFGLEEVSARRLDRFKFRTPPLRGVALSSPFMHNGCYTRLDDAIRHHLDPRGAYLAYDITQIEPDMRARDGLKPIDVIFERRNPVVLGYEPGQTQISLSEAQVQDLVAFMISLTDPRMKNLESIAPTTVPSGLPVDVVGERQFPLYE